MAKAETLTLMGARKLADRIRAYWADRGVTVEPEVVREEDDYGKNTSVYVVRSNLKFTAKAG
jgi:hypothetical protein